ncbi:NLP/P60 domain-containing protein [Gottschalkia purinilytica]|uniref:NLP/P60 domain-containing protein n=1 Tax=Gottschalkia purinilytica TaxID=1503 RepID=A0A0L0W9F5_GOTPU|nr:NlpC/P60 family protein [Gottschalkia purinilytica]KNF08071.1 NLP/P60 domain-containing protein [Gottschalkia purinilytica]
MSEDLKIKIKQVLNKFRRVRFVHNGRSLKEGVDCLGFLILFYKEFGIDIPSDDGKYIEKDWYLNNPERYIKAIRKLGYKEVGIDDLKPLDLAYFVVNHDVITHSGVIIDNNLFAHMSPKSGLLISKLERHWKKRFRGAVRIIES